MSTCEIPIQKMLAIMKLEEDIQELTGSLTVGNYFRIMKIINHKKAQIEELRYSK